MTGKIDTWEPKLKKPSHQLKLKNSGRGGRGVGGRGRGAAGGEVGGERRGVYSETPLEAEQTMDEAAFGRGGPASWAPRKN